MAKYDCNTCGNCRKVSGPDERVGGKKLQQFCFYCVHESFRSGARKIGHLASWTGRTPTWCPVKGGRIDAEKADISIGYRAYDEAMQIFRRPCVAATRLNTHKNTLFARKAGSAPGALFLAKLAWAGADVNYILTGRRTNHD